MDDYVEDYKYNNCFWMKSGLLYSHVEKKFQEYLSIGEIFKKFANSCKYFYENLKEFNQLYKPDGEEMETKSTRRVGIEIVLKYINQIIQVMLQVSKEIEKISKELFEKQFAYDSKKAFLDKCEQDHKNYQDALNKLKVNKENYFESVNKAIESFLTSKMKGKQKKISQKNRNEIEKKRKEYNDQIKTVENMRVEYMNVQGNIFASEEEFERECTNDLKKYLLNFVNSIESAKNKIIILDTEINQINEIDGDIDNKQFAEKNKSLMTGPRRNLYKEYCQDLNYYMEHFECLKKEAKGKNNQEIRAFQNQISQDVTSFLSDIIKEEPNEIHNKILEIAKKLKENRCTKAEHIYILTKFQERFNQFLKWKEEKVAGQDFRKVGEEWDERFCYMHTFLGYFNKTRVDSKELNAENFDYLCSAINKILELNGNEDIDYSLCDLVVILSSTFYTPNPESKAGKKYVNEVIRNSPIMQKQAFWIGLTKFELNEEIQQQKKEEETLNEDNISQDKINNSITAKLMSVSYNIMQFITNSYTFNKILFDIFKYCKINKDSKEIVVGMMEAQLEAENLSQIKLDKEMLLK